MFLERFQKIFDLSNKVAIVTGAAQDNWCAITDENNVNINGTVVICQKHAVPYMKKNKCVRIVKISSSQKYLKNRAYSASKTAVSHLSRIRGNKLAPFGIIVNAICPSFVMTTMMKQYISKKAKELSSDEKLHYNRSSSVVKTSEK